MMRAAPDLNDVPPLNEGYPGPGSPAEPSGQVMAMCCVEKRQRTINKNMKKLDEIG